MANAKQVNVEIVDGVMTVTLDNPKRANALSNEMCVAFLEAMDEAERDDGVRVIVITGSGKYFCSGMDLSSASSSTTKTPFDAAHHLFQRLSDHPKPTIAHLNGPALGGGVGLAFSCDLRCAHPSVFFQLAEVRRGLIPAIISLRIIPEVGPRVARRWFMTGEK
ncbi:ClpP/crotonase-like domain-containing protein, partial [Chytridium lagenaria]